MFADDTYFIRARTRVYFYDVRPTRPPKGLRRHTRAHPGTAASTKFVVAARVETSRREHDVSSRSVLIIRSYDVPRRDGSDRVRRAIATVQNRRIVLLLVTGRNEKRGNRNITFALVGVE